MTDRESGAFRPLPSWDAGSDWSLNIELFKNEEAAKLRENAEYETSLAQQNSLFEWNVYPAYKMTEEEDRVEVIAFDFYWRESVPSGVIQTYYPMAHETLPFELAKVVPNDQDSA